MSDEKCLTAAAEASKLFFLDSCGTVSCVRQGSAWVAIADRVMAHVQVHFTKITNFNDRCDRSHNDWLRSCRHAVRQRAALVAYPTQWHALPRCSPGALQPPAKNCLREPDSVTGRGRRRPVSAAPGSLARMHQATHVPPCALRSRSARHCVGWTAFHGLLPHAMPCGVAIRKCMSTNSSWVPARWVPSMQRLAYRLVQPAAEGLPRQSA